MKLSNTSVAEQIRQEAEKLAQHTPSATTKDFTKEEALLHIQQLELHIAKLESENEGLLKAIEQQEQKKVTHRKTKNLLQSIIRTIPDLIWLKDRNGTYLACNNMFERFLGAKEVDIVGKTDYDFVDEKLADFFRKNDCLAMDAEIPTTNEEWINFADDGHSAFLETIKTPMYDADNNLIGVLGIGRDITLRKKTELQLLEKDVQYKNLANSGLSLVWTAGTDKRCNYFNQSWCAFTGRSLEQELGNGWAESIHPEDFDRCMTTYIAAFDKRETFQMEYRLRHNSGNYRWILDIGTPNYNSNGEFIGYIGNCFDIDDRKQVENSLRESEDKFKKIFDNSIIGKSITSLNGQLHTNAAFSAIVGYSEEELQQKSWRDITFHEDIQKNDNLIETVLSGKKNSARLEKRFIHKNGQIVWVDLSTTLLRDSNNKPLFFITEIVDITERKNTELKLQKTYEIAQQFKTALDNVSSYVYVKNTLGQYTYANQQTLNLFNCTAEELVGKDDASIFPLNEIEQILINDQKVFGGETLSEEMEFTNKNGELIAYLEIKNPIYSNDGKEITGLLGISTDITTQKRTEYELRSINEKLNIIIENNPIAIWDWDLINDTWYSSSKYYTMLGYEPEDGFAQRELWLARVHPDDRGLIEQKIQSVLQNNSESYSYDARMRHADGSYRWQTVIGQIVERTNDGQAKRMLGVRIDINDRKRIETKLSTLFTTMTEMVAMHDLVLDENGSAVNYIITDCNKAFSRITGIEKENAIGKLASEVYGTEKAPYLEQYAQVATTGKSMEFDSYFAPMDRHFLISVTSPEKNKFATIATDISVLLQIQQQISNKNKELEDYLYIASHDLRSPLVNIQGFSQRLQKQTESIKSQLTYCEMSPTVEMIITKITTEDIPKTLDFIFSSVTKMETLINGLLQLSRTGRIKMHVDIVNMNKLMKKVLVAHNFQISELSVHVEMEDLPDCYGDEQQLNQLFSNLISNAIKYRNHDKPLFVKIGGVNTFNRVIYSIADNGIGIDDKFKERIWNIFYRVNPQAKIPGEGVGLSIVKQITEKHHGRVWVESEEGKGSTFFVELQKNKWE